MSERNKELISQETADNIDRVQGWVLGTTKEGHPRSIFDAYQEVRICTECENRKKADDEYYGSSINIYDTFKRKKSGKGKKGKKKKKYRNNYSTWHI